MSNVGMNLAQYRPIAAWQPQLGDIIIWHGWLTHWFGIVAGVSLNEDRLHIVKAGMPLLLVSFNPGEVEENKTELRISSVLASTGGKYAVIQTAGGNTVWYV